MLPETVPRCDLLVSAGREAVRKVRCHEPRGRPKIINYNAFISGYLGCRIHPDINWPEPISMGRVSGRTLFIGLTTEYLQHVQTRYRPAGRGLLISSPGVPRTRTYAIRKTTLAQTMQKSVRRTKVTTKNSPAGLQASNIERVLFRKEARHCHPPREYDRPY